ncbi:MAG: rhomboid family intramembrane serine protease [Elusimicrobiota bacterium]|nr:rhomboid family intramembrane serine protease [Endomicrobiia bacterium]MCX7910817.1 rhomboid family intramembrane serine protease [Endomicrobiia bacterium]MDW8165409.1 rhomboid family intramembrane serine protease [Elusimicrobiota bacterium]
MIPLKDNIPSYRKPFINYIIISLNTLVFIYQYFYLQNIYEIENFIYSYGLIPFRLITDFSNSWWNLFTSMFLHGGFVHFIGNMWFLYIFGDNVEDRFGHLKYFIVYILCGICGSIFQFLLNPTSRIPMIGASGAISGVLGAYFVMYPSAGILTLIPFGIFSRIVVLPAVVFLGFWIIFQFLSGTQSLMVKLAVGQDVGGVAYWAHIGGFLCGIIIAIKTRRKRRYKVYWKYL